MKKNTYFLGLVALCLAAPYAMADDQDIASRFDLRYKLGNKRQITSPELFLPLQQNHNTLLFADIRGMFDGNNNKEGNLGLGFRKLETDYIWGVYGFFDRRKSQYDAYHSQATLGAEVLTENWDFRVNGYVPLTDEQFVAGLGTAGTVFLQGNDVLQNAGINAFEKNMGGFDAEIGYQILPGLRAFAGGYSFRAGGVPDVDGFRGRLQYDINDYVRVGLEYQNDDARGENRYAEVRLRIPFGENAKNNVKGLRKRMAEPVVRDIDIVTGVKKSGGSGGAPTAVNNPDTGNAQKIWYVDNSSSTNGTGELTSPFDNLNDALNAAAAGDIVYVRFGLGDPTNQDGPFFLNPSNMQLIGSGSNLVFDGTRVTAGNSGQVLIASDFAPVLSSTISDPILSIAGTNITVAGFELTNGADLAIKSLMNDISGLTLRDLNIHDMAGGIQVITSGGRSYTSNVNIHNITMSNLNSIGMELTNVGNLNVQDVTINNNNNGFEGIQLNYNLAETLNTSLSNINVSNATTGIQLNATATTNVTHTLNNITNNFNTRGLGIFSDTGATQTVNITTANLNSNGVGMRIESDDLAATTTVSLSDASITGSNTHGIYGLDNFTLNLDDVNIGSRGSIGLYANDTFGSSVMNLTNTIVTGSDFGYLNDYPTASTPSEVHVGAGSDITTGNTVGERHDPY